MASELASAYRSASQRARVVTEAWGATNLYCPNCPSPQLTRLQHFAFPESAIVRRNPLSLTARRAGWVGCNIALNRIPQDARIHVVTERRAASVDHVRAQFRRIKPLAAIDATQRGWTLDMLNAIRSFGRREFTTKEAYDLVPQLQQLHPHNRHVREKIRQQLQVLRDSGLLIHLKRGVWKVT